MRDPIPAERYIDLLGIPFERGARGPNSYDCYGLAIEMFRRDGIEVPDFVSPGTLEEIETLISDQAKRWIKTPFGVPGTLVTLRVEGLGAHVGYMIDADRFIHAFEPTGITTERLTNGSFKAIAAYTYA